MKCPACGGDSSTLEARQAGRQHAYVRRRRECRTCAHRFTTSEVIVEERSSADIVIVQTATLKTILQLVASSLAPAAGGRVAALIDGLFAAGRPME